MDIDVKEILVSLEEVEIFNKKFYFGTDGTDFDKKDETLTKSKRKKTKRKEGVTKRKTNGSRTNGSSEGL
jgi:hypothetical protein